MLFSVYKYAFVFVTCIAVAFSMDSEDKMFSDNAGSPEALLLNAAENLIQEAKKYASTKVSCPDPDLLLDKPMDCADILEKDNTTKSGAHKIWPRSRITKGFITVYCDMDDDGGGWTLIQRRGDFDSSKDYFFKDWNSYKKGFGDLLKDFWIGNDNIFALTNQRDNLAKFVLTDWERNTTYATYDNFWIDDEDHKFTMHVNGFRGTAGDSFTSTNDLPFTTKDRDNDKNDVNCAVSFKGAWWYERCHQSNLNGYYLKGVHESHADGVEWLAFRGHKYSLKDTFIKIRPKNFYRKTTIKENVTLKKESELDITPQ